jgi:hypothetical protein
VIWWVLLSLCVVALATLCTLEFLAWWRQRKAKADELSAQATLKARAFISVKSIIDRPVSEHCTDHSEDAKVITRRIQNWHNYYESAGVLAPVDLTLIEDPSKPNDWPAGWPWPFQYAVFSDALQVALGDSSNPSNTALLGMRSAKRHECGLVIKPLNVNAVSPVFSASERSVTWNGIWTNANLEYQKAQGRIVKTIVLTAPGHPTSFRFVYRLFPGMSAAIVDGRVEISDAQGVVVLVLVAPWGVDTTGGHIRCSFSPAGTVSYLGITCPTFRITPNATDLATAVYPVEIDPTATLSGTSAIEDAMIHGVNTTLNYGGSTSFSVDAGTPTRSLLRLVTAAIPAGLHSAFRLYMYHSTNGRTVRAYFVSDANATWVEGTVATQAQTGSCCWAYKAYHATTPTAWAGSAGLGTSGTDYDADASPPSCTTIAGNAYLVLNLRYAWSQAWKNATRANGGIRLVCAAGADGINSTENASNQPYAEIDYSPTSMTLLHFRIPF